MSNPVWLVGARQSGKTEALLRIAAYALVDGECVIWCGPSRTQDDDAFMRMTSHLKHYHPDLILQIRRTNGQQLIRTTSGGMMYFGPQRSVTPNTVIADDVSADPEIMYPDARVYKATC
jgi:hypothetical protein